METRARTKSPSDGVDGAGADPSDAKALAALYRAKGAIQAAIDELLPPRTDGRLADRAIDAPRIRGIQQARLARARYLGSGLFEDPAWDMVLDLYAAHLEGRAVSVSSLCIAAAVPPTTALRWIAKLNDHGLFERRPDPADPRRAFIALSERSLRQVEAYFADCDPAGASGG